MNPVYMVLYGMAAVLILFVLVIAILLLIEFAEWMGYNIPDWMKKLKK